VLHELGRMPRRGEAIQIGGLELKVMRADRRRIESLRVTTQRDSDVRIADGG
jgi:magnesium and cobalt transporter